MPRTNPLLRSVSWLNLRRLLTAQDQLLYLLEPLKDGKSARVVKVIELSRLFRIEIEALPVPRFVQGRTEEEADTRPAHVLQQIV